LKDVERWSLIFTNWLGGCWRIATPGRRASVQAYAFQAEVAWLREERGTSRTIQAQLGVGKLRFVGGVTPARGRLSPYRAV